MTKESIETRTATLEAFIRRLAERVPEGDGVKTQALAYLENK